MKILFVIPYFEWSYGGPVRVVYEIARELSRKGHEVTIYTTDVGRDHRITDQEQIQVCEGLKVCYFKCLSNRIANNFKLHFSSEMRKAIRDTITDFDIVHLHECRGIPNLYAWYYAKKYGIPYVLQPHGASQIYIEGQNRLIVWFKVLYDLMFGDKTYLDAFRIFTLNKNETDQFLGKGVSREKINVLPNGVNLSDWENIKSNGEFRKKFLGSREGKVILYVGRLHESKGLDLLISAFSELIKELSDSILVIIGPDDGYKSHVMQLIEKHDLNQKVVVTDFVSTDEKKAALMEADVFVTPRFYGFPVTFVEACAAGTPIVTTAKGDNLLWINNKVGYVVDYRIDSLKLALLNILGDEKKRSVFAEEARKVVISEFNWENICLNIEKHYHEASMYKSISCE